LDLTLPRYHPPVKRSVTIDRHQTSISLEPAFWDLLKDAATLRGIAVNALVAKIDVERMKSPTPPGLASAIRLWLLAKQAGQLGDVQQRWANKEHYAALGQLMFDAIHAEPSPYTAAQRDAWMQFPRKGADWDARLAKQAIVMARDGEDIVGFMSLDLANEVNPANQGYIDFAYILPEARGSGLFQKLYQWIEARAIEHGYDNLNTHASLAAQPAFRKAGFSVVAEESVEIGDQMLRRFAMERPIS
jgi:putative acetyltransferase